MTYRRDCCANPLRHERGSIFRRCQIKILLSSSAEAPSYGAPPSEKEADATDIERWRELAKRVATTPAKTPEGLFAKIAFVAPDYVDDELNGTYDGILASAALDAQALANARIGEARL
jgi:hypothetical protein